MHQKLYSRKCCRYDGIIEPEYYCFVQELLGDYCRLRNRHERCSTRNPRLLELSRPIRCTAKHSPECRCNNITMRRVNIIRMDEPPCTRLEQLSYPQVYRLRQLKTQKSFEKFSKQRKNSINRLLRKSMLSLYTHLSGNVTLREPTERKKITREQLNDLEKRLNVLARPKKRRDITPPPPPPDEADMYREFRRYKRLAKPKKYPEEKPKEWHLTDAARNYVPTRRIMMMSRPKIVYKEYDDRASMLKKAMSYKATRRIKQLAIPNKVYKKDQKTQKEINQISPKALRARASERVEALAMPKSREDNQTRRNPYKVPKKALKAKASKRIIELAAPKEDLFTNRVDYLDTISRKSSGSQHRK